MKQAIPLALLLIAPGNSLVLDKKLVQVTKYEPIIQYAPKPIIKDDSYLITSKGYKTGDKKYQTSGTAIADYKIRSVSIESNCSDSNSSHSYNTSRNSSYSSGTSSAYKAPVEPAETYVDTTYE